MADHLDAGECDRLSRRGGLPSSRSGGDVGPDHGEALDAQRGRNHRQGLRAGPPHRGRGVVAAVGWRARRDTEQVRARRRSAWMTETPRRVLFVTGWLAEPALRRTLAVTTLPFAYDIAVLRITVAALMTTAWIARNLEVPPGVDLVLLPGLCEGDVGVIREQIGVRVEKGPKDLRELPAYFGRRTAAREYGDWDIEILAEINNAPRLTRDAILNQAEYFRAS